MRAPPLLVMVGPTGVGKTAVAACLAARLDLEAVSADSRQVYRGMDIGTGKPSPDERAALPHHLLDVIDPDERYHAARFRREALAAIGGIRARGALPVVVGGTGLYVRALLRGLTPAPPADLVLRAALEGEAARLGSRTLHHRLQAVAPAVAARLHPNDRVRVIRALEVAAHGPPGAPAGHEGDWRAPVEAFRVLMVGLRRERATLNRRLAGRVHDMLARGMIDEVKRLLSAGYGEATPGMAGIGYRHLAAVLGGTLVLDEAVRLTIRDTCRYAKRQMTWFAREPGIRWLDVDRAGGVEGTAARVLRAMEEEGLIG